MSDPRVRTRTFCCCIPVRAGVLLLSILTAVFSSIIAIATFQKLFIPGAFTSGINWGITLIQGCLYVFLTIVAIYGFMGAALERLEWVDWFGTLIWWDTWFKVSSGLISLITLTTSGGMASAVSMCLIDWGIQPLPGKTLGQTCEATVKIAIVTLDLIWACSILFEIWLSLIVSHYLDELVDQAYFSIGIDVEANAENLYAMGRSGRRSRRSRKGERNVGKERKRDQAIASRSRNSAEKGTSYSAVDSKRTEF